MVSKDKALDKNISIINNCMGYGMCVAKCPIKCIKKEKDILRFDYPKINEDICINCRLCIKKCQGCNKPEKLYPSDLQGVLLMDKEMLRGYFSGGVVTALAAEVKSHVGDANYDSVLTRNMRKSYFNIYYKEQRLSHSKRNKILFYDCIG